MTNWRPEGWDEVDIHDTLGDAWLSDYTYRELFEAGADAMLEALRVVHSLEGFERMTEVILKPD